MTLKVVNVGCVPGGEAFLLITEEKAAIFDAGFAFTAKPMVKKIKAELGVFLYSLRTTCKVIMPKKHVFFYLECCEHFITDMFSDLSS